MREVVIISYFNGANKKHTYFEGWYFKHYAALGRGKEDSMLAFIPGMNVDDQGSRHAFLQVVTPTESFDLSYPYSEFHASKDRLEIVVGENYFSPEGAVLNIQTEELTVRGTIAYQNFTPLTSDIMGPFRLIPFMQCNHGVESLHHDLVGEVVYNGTHLSFDGGIGYCEKDWGNSFPSGYVWIQANDFEDNSSGEKACVMLSVADIPFGLFSFRGCICSILHKGIQYRLATYKGVQVLACEPDKIVLKQGAYILEVFPKVESVEKYAQILSAPKLGKMDRFIHESLTCTVRFRFSHKGRAIFDVTSNAASFELSSL